MVTPSLHYVHLGKVNPVSIDGRPPTHMGWSRTERVQLWVCYVSTHINERGVDVVGAWSVLLQSQHHSAMVICE